jgi:hypothetical protein
MHFTEIMHIVNMYDVWLNFVKKTLVSLCDLFFKGFKTSLDKPVKIKKWGTINLYSLIGVFLHHL